MGMENTDYLTGLYNRMGMYDIWKNVLSKKKEVQILFADVDNFKSVNDIYGHHAGDRVLVRMGEILRSESGDKGAVIRLGGDEFVIIIPGYMTKSALKNMAVAIMNDVKKEASHDKIFDIISLSVGIVRNADTKESLDPLLSYADTAMYYAKEAGKNRFIFFDEFASRIHEERYIESESMRALEDGRFVLKYYPVVHLQNAGIVRSIATIVWLKEDNAFIHRNHFERVLEKNGFIKRVDLYAFECMCRDYFLFKKSGHGEMMIGIQLSHLILEEEYIEKLINIAGKYNVPVKKIEILVDEKLFGGRVINVLASGINCLREAGFSVGLMNFGEDFSSFGFLESLPISTVFFDGDYLNSNNNAEGHQRILSILFKMTREMHLVSVGQGVTDEKSVEYLLESGCDCGTGPFYGNLLDIDSYMNFLAGINESKNIYRFEFNNDFKSEEGNYVCHPVGGGIEFCKGISESRGGVAFGGGDVNTNLLNLPGSIIPEGNFTVTMWIKPGEVQNWVSAFYARMEKGFISFMPSVSGNVCMFRMHDDGEGPWTDIMTGALPVGQWSFVALVFDSFSNMTRLFINGKFAGFKGNIPEIGGGYSVCIGGDCYQPSFRGEISSVNFYDTPLTDVEIKDIYEEYCNEKGFRGFDQEEIKNEYITHDPAIFEDPASGNFYIYGTHAEGMVSNDLEHWKSLGKIITGVPKEAYEWTGSDDIWAPDIVKYGDEYRLYCSNSNWGAQQSCIFLAVSDNAEGPFAPRDIVLKTDDTLNVNGIDANIIEDHETKEQYMLYGSFWGGIHLLPLDKETGLAKDRGADGNGVGSLRLDKKYDKYSNISELPAEIIEKRMGICLARRPLWTSGSIEGPYMIYREETGYYYLFVSYGSLMSDYNIRIGRSRKITGPFLDYNGRDLADTDDDEDLKRGLMISAGYRWLTGMPYMGPGHNSVLQRANGDMFLVSHIRKMHFTRPDCGPGLLQIRRLFVTPDGWLMSGAEPYARETFPVARTPLIPGRYERIELRPSVPQGISHAHPLVLFEDGRLECCSITGTWKQIDEYSLEFNYGPVKEYVHMENGLDHDINKTTVLLSGLNSLGICTWAKKLIEN